MKFLLMFVFCSSAFALNPSDKIDERAALNYLITNVNQTRVWFYSDIPESDTVQSRLAAALGVKRNKTITGFHKPDVRIDRGGGFCKR